MDHEYDRRLSHWMHDTSPKLYPVRRDNRSPDESVYEYWTEEQLVAAGKWNPPADTGEVRITDPDTGAQKGSKLERHDLIPANALAELARVYGYGAEKYDDHNWRKGYKWGLSFAALQRHLGAFWAGQDIDPESGRAHLAHAAWHCFTLLTFMEEHPEKDDRYGHVQSPASSVKPDDDAEGEGRR